MYSVNDFNTTEVVVTLPAGTSPINKVAVSIPVVNDRRDEPTDEGFLVLIELSEAMLPELIVFDRTKVLTLTRVLDNDGK